MFVLSALGSTFSGYTHFRVSTDLQNKVVFRVQFTPFLLVFLGILRAPNMSYYKGICWLLPEIILMQGPPQKYSSKDPPSNTQARTPPEILKQGPPPEILK